MAPKRPAPSTGPSSSPNNPPPSLTAQPSGTGARPVKRVVGRPALPGPAQTAGAGARQPTSSNEVARLSNSKSADMDWERSSSPAARPKVSRTGSEDLDSRATAGRRGKMAQARPDPVGSLEQSLETTHLHETRQQTRAPKRRRDPYEDTMSVVRHLVENSASPKERIASMKREIESLSEVRHTDRAYDRAISLLEMTIQNSRREIEREEASKNQGAAGPSAS